MNEQADPQLKELLGKLSANEVRLGESISAVVTSHTSLEIRVKALETREQANEIIRAREDERDKVLHARLASLEGVARGILWLVASGFVTAIVAWILRGGLH